MTLAVYCQPLITQVIGAKLLSFKLQVCGSVHPQWQYRLKYQLDALLIWNLKNFIYLYIARHVSGTTVPIIRSFLLLHMQYLVTVWCWFWCFLQHCSVLSDAKFYLLIHCPTCFRHQCAHHQELPIAAHAVSGHRVVLVLMFPSALFGS
jgi:hypothetical protein